MKYHVTFWCNRSPLTLVFDDEKRARRMAEKLGERMQAKVWEITEDGAAMIWRAGGGLEVDQGAGPKFFSKTFEKGVDKGL